MSRYFGFDLGDAESAVARDTEKPVILPVGGAMSFITAYARLTDGTLLIGESACYSPDAMVRSLRFKSRFLADRRTDGDIRTFAAGVLNLLIQEGNLVPNEDAVFYIGCPAGWGRAARERYREIFEQAGYPPAKVVSESRAALIAACQSRHLQVGVDILSKPVLVVDAGSSTTDFAYIESGREVELQTAGEVVLGGGIMDEMLLEEAVKASPEEKQIREVFAESTAWKNYCEFAARRLKEKYFSDETYWQERECTRTVEILYGASENRLTLTLRINKLLADRILNSPSAGLGGDSFCDVFHASLRQIRSRIAGKNTAGQNTAGKSTAGQNTEGQLHEELWKADDGASAPAENRGVLPELLFLTGGVSKLPAIRIWCGEVFPEAVVITGKEPEFSVARGLACSGRIDADMSLFRREVSDLIDSSTVEYITGKHMDELYRRVVDALVDPILENAVLQVFDRWRSGGIERLSEMDGELNREIGQYLRSEDAQRRITGAISAWLKPVAYELEEFTMPICARHNVPCRALNLTTYLSVSEIDIKVGTKDVFAVEEITWMINAIVSVLAGLLCGGSGIALIAGGFKGILAGVILSMMVLLLGKDYMEKRMMEICIPKLMRRMIPRRQFELRMRRIAPEVRRKFYKSLEKDKNTEITGRLTREISDQIEQCLSRMAQIVEIPLG